MELLIGVELLVTKQRYLKSFNNTARFLLEKLKNERDENFIFYLPNMRALVEIYAQLLYLSYKDKNRQMALCVSNRLLTLALAEQEGEYNKYYFAFKPFLDKEKLDIPPDNKSFSRAKAQKLDLLPNVARMLKEEYIKDYYPDLLRLYPNISKQYKFFQYFSNYVHGNVLSFQAYGNEKFWIITNLTTLLNLTAKLIDIKILDNRRKIEIEDWFDDFNKKINRFKKFHRSKAKQISKQH